MFRTNNLITAALLCCAAVQAPLLASSQADHPDASRHNNQAAVEVEMHLQMPERSGDNGVLHVHVKDGFAHEAEGARHVLAFGPSLEQSMLVFLALNEGETAQVAVPAGILKDLAGYRDAGYQLQVFRVQMEMPIKASDAIALDELKIVGPGEPPAGPGTDPAGPSNPGGNTDNGNGLPVDTRE